MKKIAVAVYSKVNGNVTLTVENAFYKAIFLHLSNYFESAVYGVVFDLPDAPCYKSYGDREIIEAVSRCYGSLPKRYQDSFFVIVRSRRYNVNKRMNTESFSCENGMIGALNNLLSENSERYFTLGRLPDDYGYLYFSSEDGMIEAGGINALLKIADSTEKNVFPIIKTVPDGAENSLLYEKKEKNQSRTGRKIKKNHFSFFEGLYLRDSAYKSIRNNMKILCPKKLKTVKKENILSQNTYVLPFTRIDSSIDCEMQFKRKKGYSRQAYRAAVAASRIFAEMMEKDFVSLKNSEEAAMVMLALITMKTFGFLGDSELLNSSETLLDIIEEKICLGKENKDDGKALFLLFVCHSIFKTLSQVSPCFLPIKLRMENICDNLSSKISTKSGDANDIYLIMCHKGVDIDTNKHYAVPALMEAMLTDNEADIYLYARGGFCNTEAALCVLLTAFNVCYYGNIKGHLLNVPIIKAKSSCLERIRKAKAVEGESAIRCCEENTPFMLTSYEILRGGLSPVKSRLFQCGVPYDLVPYIAYFEKIIRQIPINNDREKVKICYITSEASLLLYNLLKAAAVVLPVSVCVFFDNRYAFERAKNNAYGQVEFFLLEDKERCEEIKRNAFLVRKLKRDTTLFELIEEAKEKGRFKANVKSKPVVFSHRLCAGGDIQKGFCTFFQDGKNVSYGEFITNPFTEIKSVETSFIPKMRVKLIKVTFTDEKYRTGSTFSLLTEKGEILSVDQEKELLCGEKLTVLSRDIGDAILYAVQVFKNSKEKEYVKEKMSEVGFFESCASLIEEENEVQSRHVEILAEFLDVDSKNFSVIEFRTIIGREVPRFFFSKLIFLCAAGELKGEKLKLAAKKYVKEFSDDKIFKIRLAAGYTCLGEGADEKNAYRYPFYIHCLGREEKTKK